MIKGLVYLLIFFSTLFHFLWIPLYTLEYNWNKQRYEQNCLNASRPELECQGRCQFMLKMERSMDQDQSPDLIPAPELSEFISHPALEVPGIPEAFLQHNYGFETQKQVPVGSQDDIFHPPKS